MQPPSLLLSLRLNLRPRDLWCSSLVEGRVTVTVTVAVTVTATMTVTVTATDGKLHRLYLGSDKFALPDSRLRSQDVERCSSDWKGVEMFNLFLLFCNLHF